MAGSSWTSTSGGRRSRPQCLTSLGASSETFVISDEWPILIDLQARSKLRERLLVVHPQDGKGAVVDRVGRRCREDGMEQSAERVLEKRPELGMKDSVDVVGSSLPPRTFEAPETEGPVSLLDPAGGGVELSHDLGGAVGALLRDVGRGDGVLLNAPQRPSAAVPRRSQEVFGDRCRRRALPPWDREPPGRHPRDRSAPMCGSKILKPFGLSGAGDADVQDGEVEMRDTVPPEVVHELRVASLQISRRVEVARADLPFDRDGERGHEGLDHQNGDDDAVGRPLLVREVVGVVDTERPGSAPQGTHDSDRPEPLERPPLVVVQKPRMRSPRGRLGSVPQAARTLQVNGCAARSWGGGSPPAVCRDRAPSPRAVAAPGTARAAVWLPGSSHTSRRTGSRAPPAP